MTDESSEKLSTEQSSAQSAIPEFEEGGGVPFEPSTSNTKYYDHLLTERQVSLDHKKRLAIATEKIVAIFYTSLLVFIIALALGKVKIGNPSTELTIILVLASVPTALLIGMMRSLYKSNEPINQKNSEDGPAVAGPLFVAFAEFLKHMGDK